MKRNGKSQFLMQHTCPPWQVTGAHQGSKGMAKFMYKVRYTREGIVGTVREGFVNREGYIRELTANMGVELEAVYWAYGEDDAYVIVDGDPARVLGGALSVGMSGIGTVTTVPLLGAKELDAAVDVMPPYRLPGKPAPG